MTDTALAPPNANASQRSETPDTVHGRLLESVHIAGYTWKRACDELDWILDDDRWKAVGPGFDDINAFLATIDLSAFRLAVEERKGLARKLKELQAANVSTAKALGVSDETIRRDTNQTTNVVLNPPAPPTGAIGSASETTNVDVPTAWFQDDVDPAKLSKRQTARNQKESGQHQPGSTPPLPTGTWNLIYADPPWRYDANSSPADRAIENQYPTMTLEDICALDVPAAQDAALYLWTTAPKLQEGMTVMDAWGFSYRTCAVWVKDRIGLGYYFRVRHELLLVGRRGDMPTPAPEDRSDSVIEAPRGEHSEKPTTVYELLERMYPNAQRLEMFARRARLGWDTWGNEIVT